MNRLISIILGISIALTGAIALPSQSWGVTSLKDGHFLPCPETPNCVVSENGDKTHSIEPISYNTDLETAKNNLLKVLSVVPRTEIIRQSDDYIASESKSRIFGFIDDVEFYFPKDKKAIEIRSASRVGESDLGVNRRRLEQIRLAFNDLNN